MPNSCCSRQTYRVRVACRRGVPLEFLHDDDAKAALHGLERVYVLPAATERQAVRRALEMFHGDYPMRQIESFEVTAEIL